MYMTHTAYGHVCACDTGSMYAACACAHVPVWEDMQERTTWLPGVLPTWTVTSGSLHVGAVATVRPLFHESLPGTSGAHSAPGKRAQLE